MSVWIPFLALGGLIASALAGAYVGGVLGRRYRHRTDAFGDIEITEVDADVEEIVESPVEGPRVKDLMQELAQSAEAAKQSAQAAKLLKEAAERVAGELQQARRRERR